MLDYEATKTPYPESAIQAGAVLSFGSSFDPVDIFSVGCLAVVVDNPELAEGFPTCIIVRALCRTIERVERVDDVDLKLFLSQLCFV